jgi:hypothetical protein
MASFLERSIFLFFLLLSSIVIKIWYPSNHREGLAYIPDNVELLYHDTYTPEFDSEIQIYSYGENNYLNSYAIKDASENTVLNLSVGNEIEANSQNKGFWMAGVIKTVNGDNTYDIKYNNPDHFFNSLSQIPTSNPSGQIPFDSNVISPSPTTVNNITGSPKLFLDDLYSTPTVTSQNKSIYDLSKFNITYDSAGNVESIIEKSVNIKQIRQMVTLKYNKINVFPFYNKPGYFKYGSQNYIPSYSDSVYLSKTYNFAPKSAYAT